MNTLNPFKEIIVRKKFSFFIINLLTFTLFFPQTFFGITIYQQQALDRINYYRNKTGSISLSSNDPLNQSASAHADYIVTNKDDPAVNGLGAHNEKNGTNGFIGATSSDRALFFGYKNNVAEEIHFLADPTAAVDDLINSVFHRFPLIHPDAIDLGYGIGPNIGTIDVFEIGFSDNLNKSNKIVVYPVPNQNNVPILFDGREIPDPLPNTNYPVGYPVTATFSTSEEINISEAEIKDSNGQTVDSIFLGNKSSNYMFNSAAIIPRKPLRNSEAYTVKINGTIGNSPFSKNWSFTTTPPSITGRIVNQNNQPVTNAIASITRIVIANFGIDPTVASLGILAPMVKNNNLSVTTDINGNFSFGYLPAGLYEIAYDSPNFDSQTQVIRVVNKITTIAPTVILSSKANPLQISSVKPVKTSRRLTKRKKVKASRKFKRSRKVRRR